MTFKRICSFLVITLFCYVNVGAVCNNTKAYLNGRTLYQVFTPFDCNGNVVLTGTYKYAAYLQKINATDIWFFSIAGEAFSLTRPSREQYLSCFLSSMRRLNYKANIYVGVGFLPPSESCKLAKFCSKIYNNITITYKPPTDATGGTNPVQVASDVKFLADCVPDTTVVLYWPHDFTQCIDVNIGITTAICIQTIPNFGGFIGDIYDGLEVATYVSYKSITVIIEGVNSVDAANCNQFDGHTSAWNSILPSYVKAIDNAPSRNAAVIARIIYSKKVRKICNLRTDCRFVCPISTTKQAFEIQSNVSLGHTAEPLCDIRARDRPTVTRILRENESIYEMYKYNASKTCCYN